MTIERGRRGERRVERRDRSDVLRPLHTPTRSSNMADQSASTTTDSDDSSLPTPELLAACAEGGSLIVCRAPFRTGKLFAEELLAAARLFSPPIPMRWLAPGLVLIPPGARFCGRFLRLLDALGGVRIRGDLEAAAADAAGLIAAVSEKNLRAAAAKHDVQWTLVYEAHYPAAEHSVVPFVRMHSAPSLLIGLHKALGPEHYVDYGHVTPTDADVFIVLHCKNGLLLVNQRNVERSKHPACQLLPVGSEAAAEEDGGGDRKRPRQKSLMRWRPRRFEVVAELRA